MSEQTPSETNPPPTTHEADRRKSPWVRRGLGALAVVVASGALATSLNLLSNDRVDAQPEDTHPADAPTSQVVESAPASPEQASDKPFTISYDGFASTGDASLWPGVKEAMAVQLKVDGIQGNSPDDIYKLIAVQTDKGKQPSIESDMSDTKMFYGDEGIPRDAVSLADLAAEQDGTINVVIPGLSTATAEKDLYVLVFRYGVDDPADLDFASATPMFTVPYDANSNIDYENLHVTKGF